MQQINMIGDTCKDRRIDYNLIDKINQQFERNEKKDELKERLANKIKVRREKEKKENEKGEEKSAAKLIPTDNINYINTPDELREIKGNYALPKGNYIIDFDIYVPNGCGLILEPGVEFHFTKNAGITCEGRFEAMGKDGLEVLLTAKDKWDGWKNLYLKGGAEAILDYAGFSYGKGRKDRDGYTCGGAVLLYGMDNIKPTISINHSYFENNSAEYGGAICNQINISIKDNDKSEKDSVKGGWKNPYLIGITKAILNYAGFSYGKERKNKEDDTNEGAIPIESKNGLKSNIIINSSSFENNSAKDEGGAIYNHKGYIEFFGNNRFENNSAGYGGGAIYNMQGNLRIEKNNRFENNSTQWNGGAIRNFEGKLDIDKSKNIFKGNKPEDICET